MLPRLAPYMQALMEVINHYNEDIIDRPTIDERLLDNAEQPKKLDLSEEEKENLVIFLETLSDSTILQLENIAILLSKDSLYSQLITTPKKIVRRFRYSAN